MKSSKERNYNLNKKTDIVKGVIVGIICFIFLCFLVWPQMWPRDPSKPRIKLIQVYEVGLENGSWIQEIYQENGALYSIACIKNKTPRLYKHTNLTNREFLKWFPLAPRGYQYHKGLAITRANNITYAWINLHNEAITLTGLFMGPSIDNLTYVGIASRAGYFENTRVNFRIREVWYNESDKMFYAYYDGSSIWKGTHYYVFLGVSPDPWFQGFEFEPLYEAGGGWATSGIYAPNVVFMPEGWGLGLVKGYKNPNKPYDFDCDLVWIPRPREISFYSSRDSKRAYFSFIGQEETQASFFVEYEDRLFIFSRFGVTGIKVTGRIYEVIIN